jgi:hypothetical protein
MNEVIIMFNALTFLPLLNKRCWALSPDGRVDKALDLKYEDRGEHRLEPSLGHNNLRI